MLTRSNLTIKKVAKNHEYFIGRQIEQSQVSCVYFFQVNIIHF